MGYPLVNKQQAIEHGPVEIVVLPSYKMVIFHRFLYVYQRVYDHQFWLNMVIFFCDFMGRSCGKWPGISQCLKGQWQPQHGHDFEGVIKKWISWNNFFRSISIINDPLYPLYPLHITSIPSSKLPHNYWNITIFDR